MGSLRRASAAFLEVRSFDNGQVASGQDPPRRAHAIDPLSTIFLSLFLPLPSSPRSCHLVPSPSLLKASPSALTSSLASGSPSGHVHAPSPSLVLPRSIFPRRLLVRRRKAPAMVVPPPEGARFSSRPFACPLPPPYPTFVAPSPSNIITITGHLLLRPHLFGTPRLLLLPTQFDAEVHLCLSP